MARMSKYQEYIQHYQLHDGYFDKLSLDELKKVYRTVSSVLSKRVNTLERLYPEGTVPAIRGMDKRLGRRKLSSKGLTTKEEYIEEIENGLQFLGNRTADLKEQEKHYSLEFYMEQLY